MENIEKVQLKKRIRYFKHKSFSSSRIKERIVIGIVFTLFLLYAISLLYPFVYLALNSFKTKSEFIGGYDPITDTRKVANYFWFSSNPTWDNYLTAFKKLSVGSTETSVFAMYFNSITLSIGETVVSMAMTCCAAYVLSKYKFKGCKLLYTIVLIASFIPMVGTLPAIYELMQNTKLIGTYIGMILLNACAFGGAFLYIHSYFKVIPWSFAESAMMDGASDFRIFVQIMIPLARNGILTFTILRFLGFWNDYWYPQLFYSNNPTIAVGIAGINNNSNAFPVICAAMVLAILPVLIFYAIFQKRLMVNTIDGGLK